MSSYIPTTGDRIAVDVLKRIRNRHALQFSSNRRIKCEAFIKYIDDRSGMMTIITDTGEEEYLEPSDFGDRVDAQGAIVFICRYTRGEFLTHPLQALRKLGTTLPDEYFDDEIPSGD